MPCLPVKMPNGVVGIICTGRTSRRPKKCTVCGRPSSLLCDFKAGGKTCDKPLCGACAIPIGNGIDFCPEHPR